MNFQIGDIIQFNYLNGTQPNPRFIRITEIKDCIISGMDLNLLMYRKFSRKQMVDIRFICRTQVQPKIIHRISNLYTRGCTQYILSQVAPSDMCLINLQDGNRFTNSIKVGNIYNITQDEFAKISSHEKFKLIMEK